jgi:hypothetical protein
MGADRFILPSGNDQKMSEGTLSLNSSLGTNPSAPAERALSRQSGESHSVKIRASGRGSLADGTTALNIVRLLGSFIALNTRRATYSILGKFAFAVYQGNPESAPEKTSDAVKANAESWREKTLMRVQKSLPPGRMFLVPGLGPKGQNF